MAYALFFQFFFLDWHLSTAEQGQWTGATHSWVCGFWNLKMFKAKEHINQRSGAKQRIREIHTGILRGIGQSVTPQSQWVEFRSILGLGQFWGLFVSSNLWAWVNFWFLSEFSDWGFPILGTFFFFFNLWDLEVRTENEDSLYVFPIRDKGKMESSTKSEVWKTGELWWELIAVSKCSYTQTHLLPQ